MPMLFKAIRIIIIVIPIAVFCFLFNKNFAVGGHLEVVRNFKNLSPFISEFSPLERLGEVKNEGRDYYQVILGEPIFFRLTMPQIFRTATVQVIFKSDAPILEIGAQLAPLGINYEYRPLINNVLEKLSWESIQDGETTLFQREKKYGSIADFLAQSPARKEIALYNTNLNSDFKIPNYTPNKKIMKIGQALGGAHAFYTYIKNETLNFNFEIEDVNQHAGPDPFVVIVSRENERVYSTTVEDDGNTGENGTIFPLRDVKINLANLTAGAYKVELLTTDDITIRQSETSQKYLAFIGHLNLVSGGPVKIYASGHKYDFQTTTERGFQELEVNNQTLILAEAYSPVSFLANPYEAGKINEIDLPQGNVLIEGDGLFSLSREAFFDPTFIDLANVASLDKEGINYILARYNSPETKDGWQVASTTFNLEDKAISNNQLKFALRAPNMEGGEIDIKEIKIILNKEPMTWSEFWERLKKKLRI